ncbi:MAG: hypothetical protein WC692_02180 [Erythrobacter sp.]|jgi:amino acid transporter
MRWWSACILLTGLGACATAPAPPPERLEADPFYAKAVSARGIAILASARVRNEALLAARDMLRGIFAHRPELAQWLARHDYRVAIMAVEKILGPAAGGLVAICAILKASGTCGGWIFVTGETTRWSAAAGYLPRWLATPDARDIPVRALMVMGVVMTVAVFATAAPSIGEQFETLINAVVVFTVLIYVYACWAVIRFTARSSLAIRLTARTVALLGAAFSILLIVTSGAMLMTITAALALATVPAWWFVKRSAIGPRAIHVIGPS